MILGTVELGLSYGINNTEGKPNRSQAYDVLDSAWAGGIRELDTAAGYGDSEEIIGSYQADRQVNFRIDTKLPPLKTIEEYKHVYDSSVSKLNAQRINILYLHSFDQCKDKNTISFLEGLKNSEQIDKIGISIYEPDEMEYIIENLPMVEAIQFPYNVFDNYRWLKDGLLQRAVDSGKHLLVRSIFLQGLVFRDPDDPFVKGMNASAYVRKLQEMCEKTSMSVSEFAYKYVVSTPEISDILVGCQSANEVRDNLKLESNDKEMSVEIIDELESFMRDIPTDFIDPRRWNRA